MSPTKPPFSLCVLLSSYLYNGEWLFLSSDISHDITVSKCQLLEVVVFTPLCQGWSGTSKKHSFSTNLAKGKKKGGKKENFRCQGELWPSQTALQQFVPVFASLAPSLPSRHSSIRALLHSGPKSWLTQPRTHGLHKRMFEVSHMAGPVCQSLLQPPSAG